MQRVICDLENAADEISGVKFYPLEEGGKISDEISDELAAVFTSIPGYTLAEGVEPPAAPVEKPAPKTRAPKKAAPVPAAPPVTPVEQPAEDPVTKPEGEDLAPLPPEDEAF